ncbi:ER-golgi trafficking TRAPP I complex 85 kDa subunit-domain-containing protein, partial [Phlebopus sp. FC_14]
MTAVLPSSTSPHICLLPSQDLVQLLQDAHLPQLHHILQSFSPLPQVTTRTVTLATVSHSSFALRFSNLPDIEAACHEDEEQRATRFIDWIGERTNRQCAKWLEGLENNPHPDPTSTPWWDALRRCVEGDDVPSRTEAWNHPVSIILAVSTTAPNPLQAITTLHSRILQFPSWVDTTHLLYTLIVHPRESPLSDEEAGALFNAVKRQYGIHAYLLPLSLPSPPPPPVPVPPLMPRLPPPPPISASHNDHQHSPVGSRLDSPATPTMNTLRMSEQDIQQTARFTREFVVMSLVPWMEKCVLEWNESYSSSRRLPSRLFSSTRRLFGSSTSTPQTPLHASSSSVSSLPSRSHTYTASQTSMSGSTVLIPPPSQQRRLAEFATILGDSRLAIGIWESLRKENKGGSDILPLLLSPSPTLTLHVSNALSSLHPHAPEFPPQAQLQALTYAVRWETSISTNDFLGDALEGERWLVLAAGNAEEPPAALLLAHAALLSARKNAKRRAALWYLFAANRLEKCGIKPLTMYFLRKAHDLFSVRPEKFLSPSFWDSEAKLASEYTSFDAVISGIEHPLGRLLYTTGDITGAVKLFLGLLRWSSTSLSPLAQISHDGENAVKEPSTSDKVYVEDFRVALSHLKSVSGPQADLLDLTLPVNFAIPASTRVRLPRDSITGDESEWGHKEEVWRSFWRTRGKEALERSGKAAVGETFWVDIALRNPLDTEVNLANLTTVVEAENHDASWILEHMYIDCVDEITLGAKESRTVSVAMKSSRAATLTIPRIRYDFLGLLSSTESLARRGRRLQDTPQQRQSLVYAPDVLIHLDIEEASQELAVSFVRDEPLVLKEGECKTMELHLLNAGSSAIGEVWVVAGADDQVWLESSVGGTLSILDERSELLHTDNKLSLWAPYRVPISQELRPLKSMEITLTWRPVRTAKQDLCLLFIYRETAGRAFHCTRVTRCYETKPCLEVSTTLQPMSSLEQAFHLGLDILNSTPGSLQITQVTTISPSWKCLPSVPLWSQLLQPAQSAHLALNMTPVGIQSAIESTVAFVSKKLGDVLNGRHIEPADPPPMDLICNHVTHNDYCFSMCDPIISHLVQCERRNVVSGSISYSHPHIPSSSHPHIFPLYHPLSVDILVFWEIPGEQRRGFTLLSNLTLGASHAALRETIAEAEGGKMKRRLYAETHRERKDILQAIRNSQWNAEVNPLTVTMQDGLIVEHDFTRGACFVPVTFQLRNHSLTHSSRFMIKLDPSGSSSDIRSPKLLLPRYAGRLTIRGTLQPSQSTLVHTSVWVSHPGTYGLTGWQVETDVGELLPRSDGLPTWHTRQRYAQGPPADHRPCLTVSSV